jgi:hypothetical protein
MPFVLPTPEGSKCNSHVTQKQSPKGKNHIENDVKHKKLGILD